MTLPRRHHYLPRWFLQNFCEPGSDALYVYERGKEPRKARPETAAHVRDLYSFEENGALNVEFERLLQRHEDRVAPVIAGVLDREQSKNRRHLYEEERQTLAEFVGITFARTPAALQLAKEKIAPASKAMLKRIIGSPEELWDLAREFVERQNLPPDQIARVTEDVCEQVKSGALEREEPPALRLQSMFYTGLMIAEEVAQMNCVVLLAPKHDSFITADVPMFNGTDIGTGIRLGTAFNDPKTHVWFPVASKVCLWFGRDIEPGYGRLKIPTGVKYVNRHLMRHTKRFIYSGRCSEKLAAAFARLQHEIKYGENAFVPMHDGKPIL